MSENGPVMPACAPLYELPPFEYIHIRRLSIVIEADRRSISRMIPDPLLPNGETVVIWVENRVAQRGQVRGADGTIPTTSSFEVSVDIPVRYGEQTGVTWALMYVPPIPGDGDARMAAGRELQGAPKKQAYITLREELLDDRVHVNVSRLGVDIISAVCKLTGKEVTMPNLDRIITVKTFPRMEDGGQDFKKVVSFTWERNILASKGGEVEYLELGRSEVDPVYWLGPTKVHGCVFEVYTSKIQTSSGETQSSRSGDGRA